MARIENELVGDLQASTPEVRIALTRSGVTGVHKAIRIRHDGREKTLIRLLPALTQEGEPPIEKDVESDELPPIGPDAILDDPTRTDP